MIQEILISIIIPMYNAEPYAKRCIESIIKQKFKNFEVFLIDDCSTDLTLQLCNDLTHDDNRFHVLCNDKNRGVSATRNHGLRLARGLWVLFIDIDDYISEDYLHVLYNKAVRNQVDAVFSGITERGHKNILRTFHKEKKFESNQLIFLAKSIFDNVDYLEIGNVSVLGYPFGKLIKRSLLSGIFFCENVHIREDSLFNYDFLMKANRILVSDYCGYIYCINQGSTMTRFRKNFTKEIHEYMKEYRIRLINAHEALDSYYIFGHYCLTLWMKIYLLKNENGLTTKNRIKIFSQMVANKEWSTIFSKFNKKK